jgi:hypothetical protein
MDQHLANKQPAPYLIRMDHERGRYVEAWTTHRLPFEPRGWLVAFRDELRAALAVLQAGAGEIVHAVYTSPDTARCDTENVLFYNVGSGALAGAARHGLRFERATTYPYRVPFPLLGRFGTTIATHLRRSPRLFSTRPQVPSSSAGRQSPAPGRH